MIEESGIVVRLEGSLAWVDPKAESSCNLCASNTSCGSGVITRWLSQKPRYICIENNIHAKEGDEVVIGIKESTMLMSAFIMYLVPIIALMTGAGIGQWIGAFYENTALYSILGGVLFFATSLVVIHKGTKNPFFKVWFQPVALRIKTPITI